jgi:hypothetical protein
MAGYRLFSILKLSSNLTNKNVCSTVITLTTYPSFEAGNPGCKMLYRRRLMTDRAAQQIFDAWLHVAERKSAGGTSWRISDAIIGKRWCKALVDVWYQSVLVTTSRWAVIEGATDAKRGTCHCGSLSSSILTWTCTVGYHTNLKSTRRNFRPTSA